jgi:hypothetical protein
MFGMTTDHVLFAAALGLAAPWKITAIEFDKDRC